ncbi:MAG: class II aldolase/adducin family protein [Actinomycetota bacterium]
MIRPTAPHAFPTFDSPEAERTHLKQRMAAAFRLFDKMGFGEGVAGHLTARDPERSDCFWVNPFGLSFGLIRASDLILVNHDGDVVEGDWPVNRAAFAIHSQVHQARPDVVSAAHTHSKHGRAWSTLGRLLDPLTQDACSFFEAHGLFDDYTGVVVDTEEGKRIAHALGDHKAAILRNHGILTVGHSVDEAAWLYITMERSCEVQLLAEAAGTPVAIDPDMARTTREQVGGHFACWFSFQPLYDKIVAEQPDLLE